MTTAGDDPFDEFWVLFGAELEDYLTAIETILAASPVDPTRVDELFRAFHSVKGGSAALSLRCVEKVAHAAEDLLHLVRAGKRALTADLVSVLLEAVDEMRRLQSAVMAERQDQPVNAEVVGRLKAQLAGDAAAPPKTEPPPEPKPTPKPEPEPEPEPEPKNEAKREASPPPSPPALTLDDDALSSLQNAVLSLVGVVDGDPSMWSEALVELAAAGRMAGLPGVAQTAERVELRGDWGWMELASRLQAVESATGESLGAFALVAALESRLGDLLASHMAAIKTAPEQVDGWLWAGRLLAALELGDGVELADAAATRRLLADPSDPAFSAELDDDETETVDLCALAGMSLASAMEPPRQELADLRAHRFGFESSGAEPSPSDGVHPWPAESLERLRHEIAAGRVAALAMLDLESDPDSVAAVSAALFSVCCLYNRSRLDVRPGVFEYLLAIDGGLDKFSAALAAADPNNRTVVKTLPADVDGAPLIYDKPPAGLPTVAAAPVAAPSSGPLPAGPAKPAAGAPARAADSMVRVPSAAIDGFMDMIGEMRLGLTALSTALETSESAGARSVDGRVKDELQRLERTVRALYDGAITLRVAPVGGLFNRLLRPIRDTAILVGKEVALTTSGEDVQVDKAMIEMLVDPLTHIVRNAVDHGIESPERRQAAGKPREGALRIHARQGASIAVIEIEDDGGGVDIARVRDKAVSKGLIGRAEADALSDADATQLILLPGFSTRDEVTATSGRGVGMDIVLTAIKKLGGRLSIDSRLGAGTKMVIEFPISAAMQRVLTVDVGGQSIAIHERSVREIVATPGGKLQRIGDRLTLSLRGRFLPVADLAALLGFGRTDIAHDGQAMVIVLDDGQSQLGLLTNSIAARREVFFKKLHPLLEQNELIAGAAVNGAGSVLFALDSSALLRFAAQTAAR